MVFSNELARRVADQNIISNALNPGTIKTDLNRHSSAVFSFIVVRLALSLPAFALICARLQSFLQYPLPFGALTQLYVGTSPETRDVTGGWFIPWARPGKKRPDAKDPELGTKLWEWIEAQRKGHL